MAKPVGSLIVRIGSDISGLTRGGRRMETTMGRWRRQANETASRMAMIGTAAASAAAAIGGTMVKAQLDAVQSVRRLNEVTGFQIRTIQAATVAARKYGIQQERATDALTDFSERVGEARTGTGEAIDGFKLLEQASGRQIDITQNVNKVWDQFITAMGRVEDQSTKSAAAAMIGGDALRDFIPALNQGADGFREAADQAEAFGFAMNKIDVQQAMQAQRSLSTAGAALEGVVQRAAIELAPVIEAVANRFVAAAKDSSGFRDQVLNGLELIAMATAPVINSFKTLQIAVKGIQVSFHLAVGVITQGLADILALNRDVTNKMIDGINKVIEAWNKLGVLEMETIGRLKPGDAESALARTADAAGASISDLSDEMAEVAGSMIGFDEIAKTFEKIRSEARKAAGEATDAPAGTPVDTPGGGGDDEEEKEKRKKKLQERLEMIRKAGLTQREIEQEQFEQRMEWLREAKERELLTEKEFRNRKENLEAQHNKRMAEHRRRGMSELEKFTASSYAAQTKTVASHLAQMTSTVAGENKRMFQLNKAAGIAEAVVNAYTGISKTLAAYPYPINIAMAAAHAATAFAQVQKIKSQSFNGGGSGTTAPSTAGSTPSGSTPTTETGGGGSGPTREATFNIQGDNFGPGAIEQIADGLNEFMGDNGDLKVNVRRAT